MGLYISIGVLLILAARREMHWRSGLTLEAAFMVGLASGRVLGLLVDGVERLVFVVCTDCRDSLFGNVLSLFTFERNSPCSLIPTSKNCMSKLRRFRRISKRVSSPKPCRTFDACRAKRLSSNMAAMR
ncbi:DUF4345 domain-containing protein [Formosimonas limnophila]|uniref:DUF4345 domain-containing protein n=1 Tax=Formosimonas limnophila TaxID=1384487 RepID=UPI0035714929